MVPISQLFIDWYGWAIALLLIAAITALIVPLARPRSGSGRRRGEEEARGQSLTDAVREAGVHRGFLLLSTAYFVCGFQTRFVGTHFPAMLQDFDISTGMAATALTLIGFFNIIGCFFWGRRDRPVPREVPVGLALSFALDRHGRLYPGPDHQW